MPKGNRVAYFYDDVLGKVYYAPKHPMKPPRLMMCQHLVVAYGLHKKMDVFKPREATPTELCRFHSEDYIDFMSTVTPDNVEEMALEAQKYGLDSDCPAFEDLATFCNTYTGASIEGAQFLNSGAYDIAINWSGGLHHAKKSCASGFCYINDLVLAILELLKCHSRVLYVDIDVHHGDGVEEAFYLTDRVMTVSFHKYGDNFFPGTGDIKDVGEKNGRFYSVNVPLRDGTDDVTFCELFKQVMSRVMEVFKPGAIVLQCGADSLAHDRLGCFNLSLKGHAEAVKFMKNFGVPMLVTGGGGYTKANVSRCWTYETAVLVDEELDDEIPANKFYEYYKPDHKLHMAVSKDMANHNAKAISRSP
ncbi:unnamed protein product [Ostreobium quekettii]|uniref:histone deacetylase n=1 Tax=Ostreobium quekettii TaxID=121088 RepID=A0A8S1IRG0_9CHLO|nr:unnamed protein product [Ostreobium quekettii]